MTQVVYRLVGTVEITVGLLLLLPPHRWWEMRLATGLAAAFVVYLLFSIKAAPGRPCGCFGGREVAVSWRTLARAGLLLALTVIGWQARRFWFTAIVVNPWQLSLVAIEALLLVGLSPEFDWTRARLLASANHPSQVRAEADCETATVPLSETLQQLRRSAPFRALYRSLGSEPLDYWREGCWRFLCFEAEYEGRKATVVFAVPILWRPHRVRAAVVDETDGTVLLLLDHQAAESHFASCGGQSANQG